MAVLLLAAQFVSMSTISLWTHVQMQFNKPQSPALLHKSETSKDKTEHDRDHASSKGS